MNSPPTMSTDKWDARISSPVSRVPHPLPHDTSYYLKCMLGGVLSCGLTHTAVCPLDVVKCKMQVFPEKYTGLLPGIRTVLAEEGAAGLSLGWAPTAIGYSMQVCMTPVLSVAYASSYRISERHLPSIGFMQVRFLRVLQGLLHELGW